jgi:NAD-dependent dihydropyrimidine dehydrogenase PreA subunit
MEPSAKPTSKRRESRSKAQEGTLPGKKEESGRPAGKKRPARITIDRVRCKACEICVDVCPHDVLEMDGAYPKVVAIERCTLCQLCDYLCPDFAIIVREVE